MSSLTPSKPRRLGAAVVDDHTDVTSSPEIWEGPDDVNEVIDDPEGTKETAVAIRAAAPVLTPTNKAGQAAPRDDYHLEPGTALGEYRIETKIGQGGMGVVFSAVHPLIGKRAAIKILNKELCADPHSLQRFVDEARVVNEIGHPNIVDVFAFGEMPDGRSYFVMEWLKGETLRARIARSSMDAAEVNAIIRPLARALEAAHEKGVIHRDLKPDNVFLVNVRDEVPTVKLLDFGIAKLARNDTRVEKTATGAIVGTPQYIAPEQAKGYAIDHRADIYALGGIIFELLTGRPPFVADNAMEMVAKHLMEMPLPPSHFTASVAPELDDLVLRMLAKKPEGRPSLAEVCQVIERAKVRASTPLPFAAELGMRARTGLAFAETTEARAHPGLLPANQAVAQADLRSHEYIAPSPGRCTPALAAVATAEPTVVVGRRRRPLWLALVVVPLAGLAAFLVVRALEGDIPSPSTSSKTSPAVTSAPATSDEPTMAPTTTAAPTPPTAPTAPAVSTTPTGPTASTSKATTASTPPTPPTAPKSKATASTTPPTTTAPTKLTVSATPTGPSASTKSKATTASATTDTTTVPATSTTSKAPATSTTSTTTTSTMAKTPTAPTPTPATPPTPPTPPTPSITTTTSNPPASNVSTAPTTTAAKPLEKGQLRLIIVGARAPEIFIDGKRSSAEVKLRPGFHDVEIRARGMQTRKLRVDVAPTGVTTQRIALAAPPKVKAPAPRLPKKTDPPKVDSSPGSDGNELLSPGSLSPSPLR